MSHEPFVPASTRFQAVECSLIMNLRHPERKSKLVREQDLLTARQLVFAEMLTPLSRQFLVAIVKHVPATVDTRKLCRIIETFSFIVCRCALPVRGVCT